MRVFKRPRSPYYYFDFDLGGQTHVKSTRLKNERQALDYAAAYRLKLIKQQVGIVEEEKPKVRHRALQVLGSAQGRTDHGQPVSRHPKKGPALRLAEAEGHRQGACDRPVPKRAPG